MKKPSQAQRIVAYVSSRKTPATVDQISKITGIGITTVRARVAEFVREGTFRATNVNTTTSSARKGYTAA